jgi:hypothetical protein
MGVQSDSAILFALLISLTASSFCVAWIVNDYAQAPICGIGQTCAPISVGLQEVPYNETVTDQDYTNVSTFDPGLLVIPYNVLGLNLGGAWTQGAGGYTLTASAPAVLGKDPTIHLQNIVGTNQEYTVDYIINNPTGATFYITPRAGDFADTYFTAGFHSYVKPLTIDLIFDSQGVHIPGNSDTPQGDVLTVLIPNAQITNPGGSLYSVTYNELTKSIKVSKDGTQIVDETGLAIPDPDTISQAIYYGGVSSNSVGFSLVKTTAIRSTIPRAAVTTRNYIDDIVNLVATKIPGATQVLELIGIMGQVVFWTLPETIFPLWLNFLLIKTQGIIILYIMAKLARGGG